MLAMASGRSANKRAISAGDFRWRSALRARRRPAVARLRWLRMQVKTSSTSRCSRLRVADAIGGQQRQMQFARDFHGRLIARFFFAAKMPLQFHIDIFAAE